MMTQHEARQRLAIHSMRLQRNVGVEYRITFAELGFDQAEPSAYYTDDLEDAVLTGAKMRSQRPLSAAA